MVHLPKSILRTITTFGLLLIFWGTSLAETVTITLPRQEESNADHTKYFLALLRLGLDKLKRPEDEYRLEFTQVHMTQNRMVQSVARGQIDLFWTMTSKEREAILSPVRVPLLKGLLGHRIFIINQKDQKKFAQIQTLEDLKKFNAGQGVGWPDVDILRANDLKVVTISNYELLFGSLQKGRFDYFPRGVNEPWSEIRRHPEKDFVVEKHLLLQYPAPIYFFVGKQNQALADYLEKGLKKAIQDGSFDEIFFNHPTNKEIFELAKIKQRKIFRLTNPLLTPETPLDAKDLWYQP